MSTIVTGGTSFPPQPQQPQPVSTGWRCPCCGVGVAPFIAVCPRCPPQAPSQPAMLPSPIWTGDPPPGGQWTWSNPSTVEVKGNFPIGAVADEPSSEVEIVTATPKQPSAPAPRSDADALWDELNEKGERRFPLGST